MRIRCIACEVLYRELCFCAARSRNIVDLTFLSQGLHDLGPEKMSARIQGEIDATDAGRYDGIALGFALCNHGIAGLRAPADGPPVVVPRAHDCITLFFGSHAEYMDYFNTHPGTYFLTTGWQERDKDNLEDVGGGVMGQLGIDRTYQDYVEKYGEENAKYLMETLGDWTTHYKQMTHIDMGVTDESEVAADARRRAEEKGWSFETVPGNLRLLQMLLDADWPTAEFLRVEPKQTIRQTSDDRIVEAEG